MQSKQKQLNLPDLQAVHRINNFPIVETGWKYAGEMYSKIKNSNNLISWTLDQAENSVYTVIDTASPGLFLLEGPLSTIDRIICKSLDVVESKVPSINLPPQMIYFNTKQYVSDVGTKLVRPVLKRADSVKQIGNSVLASKYTEFAADKLDGALNVADKYVEKYLPAEVFDNPGNEDYVKTRNDGPASKALQTSQHMYRFSKKLQRRLTKRTLMEAKALKDQSTEAIHVLVYVAEMIATDPKLALQKGRELWSHLSKDEPENQARPENLEQLLVLLSRETARRVVHLVNFTTAHVGRMPGRINGIIGAIRSSCLQIVDGVLKTVRLDGVAQTVREAATSRTSSMASALRRLNIRTTDLLEQLALVLSNQQQQQQQLQQQQQQQQKPIATISVTNSAPIPLPPPPPAQKSHKQQKQQQNYQHNASQDTLRPPTATRTQLKATHQSMGSVSNGESVVKF